MVVMSPIVERRKRNSVVGRRVNGLHRLPFTDSGNLWLARPSSDRSVGFPLAIRSKEIGGGMLCHLYLPENN